ncbi:hypothetical protein SBV1_120014 [Verrucomicrobia bacterium]|nr:hypothetical protein SBV1_120014 [Verrucomicrobiota bacterium]
MQRFAAYHDRHSRYAEMSKASSAKGARYRAVFRVAPAAAIDVFFCHSDLHTARTCQPDALY